MILVLEGLINPILVLIFLGGSQCAEMLWISTPYLNNLINLMCGANLLDCLCPSSIRLMLNMGSYVYDKNHVSGILLSDTLP